MKSRMSIPSFFLALGASVFLAGCGDSYPLHTAVIRNDEAKVTKLITQRKIDITATNPRGEAAMNLAAAHGHIDMMKLLTRNGASVNARSAYSWTPLMDAAISGQVEAAQWLIEQNCDTDTQNNQGATALYLATHYKQDRICDLILDGSRNSVNTPTNSGWTPLMAACCKLPEKETLPEVEYADRQLRIIERLLDAGADINARRDNGETALHVMAKDAKQTQAVPLLMSRGSDTGVMDNYGKLPIHTAVVHENRPAFEAMIRKTGPVVPHDTAEKLTGRGYHLYAEIIEKEGSAAQALDYYAKAASHYRIAIDHAAAQLHATEKQISDLRTKKLVADLLGAMVAGAASAYSPSYDYYYVPGRLDISGLKTIKELYRRQIALCEDWLQECEAKTTLQTQI